MLVVVNPGLQADSGLRTSHIRKARGTSMGSAEHVGGMVVVTGAYFPIRKVGVFLPQSCTSASVARGTRGVIFSYPTRGVNPSQRHG